jgi:hypothetical protein
MGGRAHRSPLTGRRSLSPIHVWAIVVSFPCASVTTAVKEHGSCTAITSVSMLVAWRDALGQADQGQDQGHHQHHPSFDHHTSEIDVDMFMLGVYLPDDPLHRPSVFLTSSVPSVTVDDLFAGRVYEFRTRRHNSTLPSRVWGWGNWSTPWSCRTATLPLGAPAQIWAPGPVASDTISVKWIWPSEQTHPNLPDHHRHHRQTISILVRWSWSHGTRAAHRPTGNALGGTTTIAAQDEPTLQIVGLAPASTYLVTVGASDAVRLRTSAAGIVHTEVFRVSEGTHDIDLLENHNSGDRLGEASFLTDSSNFPVPWQIMRTNPCAAALNRTSCTPRGGAACETCLHNAWQESSGLRQRCSDPAVQWPLDNKVVEAWCGTAFKFFDWEVSTVDCCFILCVYSGESCPMVFTV